MSDRDDLDQGRAHAIHQAEGKPREYVAARSATNTWPRLRRFANPIDGVFQVEEKASGRTRIAIAVPCQGPVGLSCGGGMDPKLAFSHLGAGASHL